VLRAPLAGLGELVARTMVSPALIVIGAITALRGTIAEMALESQA
jgi:mannose/fructose/N-acetylgalactosamine-specific phosphotransferase system component IID